MDYDTIADIFDAIYETGALIIKPAVKEELDRCDEDLANVSAPKLPSEYTQFLKIANGMAWNGFEFFGTYQVTVKKSGYVLQDIVSMNARIRQRKFGFDNLLLLGRFDDDIYVYKPETDQYQALDSLTLIEVETYDTFEDLIVSTVGVYADDDDYDDEDDFDESDSDETGDDEDADEDNDVTDENNASCKDGASGEDAGAD